ncbi:MAG: glycosyltransferase family 4 protein [Actinobacteria bacterium]|nr:glycosyltransferase family 4 protein [Actinomycetota bacterium]
MRVTIVNLFYPPNLAPSAHLAASLAEHRAALGDQVTVVCGTGGYLGGSERGARSAQDGGGTSGNPRVIRLWTPALGKASTARRLGDYVSFLVGAIGRLLTLPRQDVVIALTTPPFILVAAVAHRLLHPRTRIVLWSHDVYPDAAEAFGTIRPGGIPSRALRAISRWLFRRVDHVVAVDQAMLHRVRTGYARDGGPAGSVIPTWEPLSLFPGGDRPARWKAYEDPDLAGRFIVLHLGNLGFGHRTDTIGEAAAAVAEEGVTFLFVGGGERFPELADEAARRHVENIRFRGYVPKEQTPAVLAGADCVLISLDDRSIGIMSPSKMNAGLAMGLPVLYAGPTGTNVDEAITGYGCGFSLRQGDVAGLADAIRRLRSDPDLAEELSKNARRAFEETYSDRSALARFDSLLEELTGAGSRPLAG